MSKTFEVTKDFSAELAGTRVGWATVEPVPYSESQFRVNIVSATVGEAGASAGYDRWENGDNKNVYNSTEFLAGAVAVHAFIEDGKLNKEHGVNCGVTKFRDQSDNRLLQYGVEGRDTLLTPEDWADSSQELLSKLQARLGSFGLESCYPTIYYNLNMTIGLYQHPDILHDSDAPSSTGLFLPDANLATVTKSQKDEAGDMVSIYDDIVTEDTKMRQNLTVFSDISPKDVPDAFVQSRYKIASKEELLTKHKNKLLVPRGVYMPVGFRPSGRTWPYMDPTADNDQGAFGRELGALRVKNTVPARHELDREISEAVLRRKYAATGHEVLYLLSQEEKKLLKDA